MISRRHVLLAVLVGTLVIWCSPIVEFAQERPIVAPPVQSGPPHVPPPPVATQPGPPPIDTRAQRTLTVRTQLRPVGWKSDVLWFGPGTYWVDAFDGGVQSGPLAQTANLRVWNSKATVAFGPGFIRFERDGGVKEGTLSADTSLCVVNTTSNNKLSLTFRGNATVEFGYDGCVMKGTLAQEATLKSWDGGSKAYPPGTVVDFNGAGLVTRAVLPPAGATKLDGIYNGTCTIVGLATFPFGIRASSGVFGGGQDQGLYSLQWQGNYGQNGNIQNGLMTGWVDVVEGGQKVRWTVRGPITGTLTAATLTITTADGKRRWTGTCTGAIVPGGQPAAGAPTFGPLDAGGMPCGLIWVRAGGYAEGQLLLSKTPYFVWMAPQKAGQQFTQAVWRNFGPFTFAGGQRFTFRSGSIANDGRPTSTEISPGLASLSFENGPLEPAWFIVNPLQPGCGRPDSGTGGTPPVGTGGGAAAGTGQWIQTDSWTSKWSNWDVCGIAARVEGGAVSAATESSNTCDSANVRFRHSWTALPKTLQPAQPLELQLSAEDAGSAWTKGQGRGYTAVFVGTYDTGSADLPQDVRIKGIMDYACEEKDSGPLFAGDSLGYVASRIADWGYKARSGLRPIRAAMVGAAFLCRGGGKVANRAVSVPVPTLDRGDTFLVIVVGGHGVRATTTGSSMDVTDTIGAHHTLYVEYSRKK